MLVCGAVAATLNSGTGVVERDRDAGTIIWVEPIKPSPPDLPIPSIPRGPAVSLDFPVTIPLTIPPVDSSFKLDSLLLARTRLGSDVATPPVAGVGPESTEAVDERAVDERPEQMTTFNPEYPDLLRQAGIEGLVVIEVIIDTAGRSEPASLRVMQSTNRAFDAPAREAVLRTVYRPGRVRGHPVRVLVQVPISFSIRH